MITTPFLFIREAKFHILITSYQLLVQDEKFFRRVKWQYMVLDEAQAIKNSTRFDIIYVSEVHKWTEYIIYSLLFLTNVSLIRKLWLIIHIAHLFLGWNYV